jgi:hypothetical protein
VQTLSKRMADLMATLDDMAQDLRDALEAIAASATETSAPVAVEPPPPSAFSPSDREAAYQYLRERASVLTRPIDWASLAWEIQREFGQDIVNGWLGHDSFKDLLLAAVPSEQVISESPGYVIPPNFNLDTFTFGRAADVPRAAVLLHEADRSFSLSETACWREAYRALAAATADETWDGDTPSILALTKRARDISNESDVMVTRRQLDHIARVLLAARELRPQMSATEIGETFREWTKARAAPFVTSPSELAELDTWLGG